MKRKCKGCDRLIYGRSDKRFCEDSCRTAWHNRRRRYQERHYRPVWRQLRKNHQVLFSLYHSPQRRQTPPRLLLRLGYDFTYHTACDEYGNVYCFDYGYRWMQGGQWLMIIQAGEVF